MFEQKYEKYQTILSEHFHFLVVNFFNIFEKACFRNEVAKQICSKFRISMVKLPMCMMNTAFKTISLLC